MTEFAGWELPLHYGSQLEEHRHVRRDAGIFDISHMSIFDIGGADTDTYLSRLLTKNAGSLQAGQAIYTCMLNHSGGIIDDLIVYRLDDRSFRIVSNAATRGRVDAWLKQHAATHSLSIRLREDLSMLALQGPHARDAIRKINNSDEIQQLRRFRARAAGSAWIARTGYTGEDGFEIMLPHAHAVQAWQRLVGAGVKAAGLGARDTLRLEAGLNLYGADMNEQTTPLEVGLGWTVDWRPEDREFIGRTALEHQRIENAIPKRIGLILDGRGILRAEQTVFFNDAAIGVVTSGGFSPTLQRSIALARIAGHVTTPAVDVKIRGKMSSARIVTPPFVQHGDPVTRA